MKALWVVPYLFYPMRAGGQFSIYPWAKELAQRGWKLFLVQYDSPQGFLKESIKGLSWAVGVLTIEPKRFKDRGSYVRELVLSDKSFFRLRNEVPQVYEALRYVSFSKFAPDLIILSHSYMGFLIPFLRELFPRAKILVDLHNLEWRAYSNLLGLGRDRVDALINLIRLREEERRALSLCDGVVFLSPLEGKYAKVFGKPLLWRPARFPEEKILSKEDLLRNKDLVITTSLNIYLTCLELLDFIKNVWVKYKAFFKDASFWVLGREPLSWFVREASEFEGVRVLGWVEDPSPYIRRARLFVAPFRKTMGSLTKVISAWSWGLPVVTTSIVAKGLKGDPDKHFLVGDDPEELLSACFKIATDDDLALGLSERSYNFVREEYALDRFVTRFEEWLRERLL